MLFKNENKFNKEFLQVSQETGVPVSILKGFAALESNFDEKSYRYEPHISDASYGLMQILYKTAQGLGYKGKAEGLYSPLVNIRLGTEFLKRLLQKYPNLPQAIAAYNMGFPRLAKNTTPLIKKLYGEPKGDWTFANEPYVRRVASYIAYYQAIENGEKTNAEKILALIRSKDTKSASAFLKEPLLGFSNVSKKSLSWLVIAGVLGSLYYAIKAKMI